MSNKHVFSTTLAGRPLSVEIGELAKQANGAVLVRYGDTVVLSAAVASKKVTPWFYLQPLHLRKPGPVTSSR